ncbi:hypothetical protein ACYT69_11725, partial [Streptococcus pyogenes]
GLLFPTLALIPLGSLWLWQHGYLLWWAGATLACTLIAYAFERYTLGRAPPVIERKEPPSPAAATERKAKRSADAETLRAEAE